MKTVSKLETQLKVNEQKELDNDEMYSQLEAENSQLSKEIAKMKTLIAQLERLGIDFT